MTALQLNADIYRNLGIIAEDESMLDKAAKYLRRLVKQMTDDPTRMTKEEFFARIDEAREEIRQGKGKQMLPNESLDDFLKTSSIMYEIIYSPRAIRDILRLQHSEPAAYKKVANFIEELREHPRALR